ncbi:MAG TPA: FAD:protein FMN transferase [Chloroflexota bacterium]|nr:FAD:protein FMN transferase [Chloroflexota bacterium]
MSGKQSRQPRGPASPPSVARGAARTYQRTVVLMDTHVTVTVVDGGAAEACDARAERAFAWFRRVEECCTRFEPTSEVMALAARVGEAVEVSPILFQVVRFALAVAAASDGAFDPTVGYRLESRGFNRSYRTGRPIVSSIEPAGPCSFRDVRLDATRRTITLVRPLILDLGAVAKGFAVDLAARELRAFADVAIDAGGDLFVRGHNADGEPWRVGIRHPRRVDAMIETVSVSDASVCTSGDYERRSESGDESHHIVDPRTDRSPDAVASVTVIAPTTMLADALGTAAFVLGPTRGLALLESQGVDGLIVSPSLERFTTRGFRRYLR